MKIHENNFKKLFNARDLEGNPNYYELAIIRSIGEKLEGLPTYVGIRFRGSIVKGYATPGKDGSDIDAVVLYDVTDRPKKYKGYQPQDQLMEAIPQLREKIKQETGRDVQIDVTPISMGGIKRAMAANDYIGYGSAIAELTWLAVGEKIDQYRSAVRKIIDAYTPRDKEKIFHATVNMLVLEDEESIPKWQKRTQMSNSEINNTIQHRRSMWEKRVKLLFGSSVLQTDAREDLLKVIEAEKEMSDEHDMPEKETQRTERDTNLERFWEKHKLSIEEKLRADFRAIFTEKNLTIERRENKITYKLASEKAFLVKVLPRLQELIKGGKNVLALFDVDSTIGNMWINKDKKYKTIIRPAFQVLLDSVSAEMQSGKLKIGLITSRKDPINQLDDPNHLGSIKSQIDLANVYPVDSMSNWKSSSEYEATVLKMAETPTSVVKPNLSEDDFFNSPIGSEAFAKLLAVQEAHDNNPHNAIMVIDDQTYTEFLNPSNDIHGVWLPPKARFETMS